MKLCNLCLHAGAAEVPRAALVAVPTPAPTETWRPLAHEEFVRRVVWEMPRYGLDVVQEVHALTYDGSRYFGLVQVAREGLEHSDYSLIIGLRNSHDKSLPAGLVAGSQVYVCDNLAFSGEVQLARKHTPNIMRDLPSLVGDALGRLLTMFKTQDERVQRYKNTRLSDAAAHDLCVRALDARAICASKIPALLHEWREPRYPEFKPRNLWSFFNATSEVMKNALHLLPKRSQAIHQLCDQYAAA